MTRCPNCARTVRFWHNQDGYCSRQCRTESISSCPQCGKVGLFKHERLGCCSEECRFWYVAGLLGYDKEALLTPAWDKVVYHVRLPSNSAEISSLQFDELEYDRALDTVLVIAAPPWMARSRVLAELPYERFDNAAWQHLWADGTLSEDELFRFHRLCYEDDGLCQKLGEHVYAKLRQPTPFHNAMVPPPGYLDDFPSAYQSGRTAALAQPTQLRLTAPSLISQSAPDFVAAVRAIFESRGYTVMAGASERTFLLQRGGRTALAAYHDANGLSDIDVVQRALAVGTSAGAAQVFVVTGGRFTLQAEDLATAHSVQLIDGAEMALLAARPHGTPTLVSPVDLSPVTEMRAYGPNGHSHHTGEQAEVAPVAEGRPHGNATLVLTGMMNTPVDAEIIADEESGER